MDEVPQQAIANPGSTSAVGQRRLFYFNDNGQPAYQVYDLTVEDFLNPQIGDAFFHGEIHDRSTRILASMLHHHYRYSPTTTVHVRPKVIWHDSTLAQPMPDIVIVNNLREPQRQRTILDMTEERSTSTDDSIASSSDGSAEGEVTLRAIFEVTSPLLAEVDLESKLALYERVAVPEYWIIDTGLRPENDQPKFTILGYRLEAEGYHPIAQISEAHWESKACRLWLIISADRQSFQLGDLRSGSALPMPSESDDPAISALAEANRHAQSIAGQLKL